MQAKGGDRYAYIELDKLCRKPIKAYIRRLAGPQFSFDDVEDVAQDVAVRIYRAIPAYDPNQGASWISYVFALTRNALFDRKKKDRKVASTSLDSEALIELVADESLAFRTDSDQLQMAKSLEECLGYLTREDRDLIEMHHLEGQTLVQVSEAYQITASQVRGRLFRLRKRLQRCLKGKDPNNFSEHVDPNVAENREGGL